MTVSLLYDCGGGSVTITPARTIVSGACQTTWPAIPPGCTHTGIILYGVLPMDPPLGILHWGVVDAPPSVYLFASPTGATIDD